MSKTFMTKRKAFTAILAVVMAVCIIFGGTFAWQSINQEALNEVSSLRNPGGRLHDDFVEITYDADGNKVYQTMTFDKDVYVENFTSYADNGVQVFARVRLDEYMEFGVGAGNEDATNRDVKSLVHGAKLEDKNTWTTYVPGENSVFNAENPFSEYWNWEINTDKDKANDGVVTYLPTFNKNKDSLEADINGTFDADFTDYTKYTDGQAVPGKAVYDADDDDADEIVENNWDADTAASHGHVDVKDETHTTKQSLSAYVITMDEWLKLPADQQTGNFWVWDRDGWAYWANPVNPETATGVLLDGISRKENVINDDWYYAINVVAQFVTREDLGKDEGTGFYDTEHGKAPSKNALTLLNTIGVYVNTTVANSDVTALQSALELGGNMNLSGIYSAEAATNVIDGQYPVSYLWTTGGSLNGGHLTSATTGESGYAVLFINTENNYPEAGDGATAAIVNNLTVEADMRSAVNIQAINADVTLNDVTVKNYYGVGVYAEYGTGKVTLNGCTVQAPTEATGNERDWALCAVAAAGDANIVINGGEYTGKYAAYVYSTGGSITILDGTFNGELKADAGKLTIKGGTFSVDPSAFVDLDTYVVEKDANGMYVVK